MRVVGHERAAGIGAMARHREAVAAGLGEPAEPLLRLGSRAAAAGTGDRDCAAFHQARPEIVPARACAQREKAGPDQPVDVRAGEASRGEHVLDCPGLGLQAENVEVVRQLGGAVLGSG